MESVFVAVRVHPLSEKEKNQTDVSQAWQAPESCIKLKEAAESAHEGKSFSFDTVFAQVN